MGCEGWEAAARGRAGAAARGARAGPWGPGGFGGPAGGGARDGGEGAGGARAAKLPKKILDMKEKILFSSTCLSFCYFLQLYTDSSQ